MDGTYVYIELYGPDGELIADWADGEEGLVAGVEYLEDWEGTLELTGTYVFRVIHLGGNTDPFTIRIFT